jgi:L-serine/L-threonine ammonia-lyase
MVAEIAAQLPSVAAAAGCSRDVAHAPPGCILASVGGGGLLMGVLRGCAAAGWTQQAEATLVVAVETVGADCLAQALAAGRVVTLQGITSVAKSLGAPAVSPAALAAAQDPMCRVSSHVVTDDDALAACVAFLNDHRILVEPACGAALAPVYAGTRGSAALPKALASARSVVVIVCGGACVDARDLREWKH